MKLKQGCVIHSDYGLNIAAEDYTENGIPIIRTSDIDNLGRLDLSSAKYVNHSIARTKKLKKGDLLFSRSGTIGRAMVYNSDVESTFAAYLVRFRPHPECLFSQFVAYWSQSSNYWKQIGADTIQSTIGNFNANKFANLSIPLPDLLTQRAIADFLDHETARIDLLIEKKEKMVEVIKEQSIAKSKMLLDSHLTSKTLKIKHFARLIGGGTPPKEKLDYWLNGDVLWVSPKDMKQGLIIDTEDKITEIAVSETSTNYIPENTVLIVVRSGILRHTIPVALSGKRLTLNQDMKGFIMSGREVLPEMLLIWIKAKNKQLLHDWKQEGATVESLNTDRIMNTLFDIPTLEAQEAIVGTYRAAVQQSEALTSTIERSLKILSEYRSSLITAAVTGQIDVQNWQRSGESERRLDALQERLPA